MTETVKPRDRDAVNAKPFGDQPPHPESADARTDHPADEAPRRGRLTGLATTVLIALAVIATFAGAALGYSLTRPKVYGAEAEIVLTPRPELSDAAVDRAMLTHVMVAQGTSVLQPVAARTGIPVRRLQEAVSVEILGRSNILLIRVADRDRTRALTLADLVVAEYAQVAPTVRHGDVAPVQLTLLAQPRPLDRLLEPQPARALAAGTLLGVVAAVVVVFLLRRPRGAIRTPPYWR